MVSSKLNHLKRSLKMFNRMQFLILSLLISYSSLSYSLQIKPAKDNETLLFKVSATDFNKIFITSDHITSVKGKNGSYDIKEFNNLYDQGILYIKPSATNQNQAFSLFINTEQGHTYTLFLTPLNIPAETIQITPITAAKNTAIKWETNSPYSEQMITLMKNIVNDERPEGYAVIDIGQTKPKRLTSGISMQLLRIYRGGMVDGEIWKLKNNCKRNLNIHPKEFYEKGTRCISLLDESIGACDETVLYRIIAHA